jgi:hypothetical protein
MPRIAIEKFIKSILSTKDASMMLHNLTVLQSLLDQLFPAPLDYDVAVSRINNARRFLESHEAGAARYEMRQLIQCVDPSMYRPFGPSASIEA